MPPQAASAACELNAEVVRELLSRLNMTHGELALRAEITPSYLSRLRSGERCPSAEVRERLMITLGVRRFDDLFVIVKTVLVEQGPNARLAVAGATEPRMPETLYRAIRDAIANPLDGTVFEQCAVALLQGSYPSLRSVEGGNDAGMDGVGELPDDTPFFLVATVQEDARGNLDRNIQSHIDAGGERRTVVFATSRPITGRRWLELDEHIRDKFGVRLAAVHDRADFVDRLYRNAAWRLELLGVPGEARALSRLPATRRPTVEIPLIGRDEEIERLEAIEGDLVVVGKPGIGKTFLLQKLVEQDWGLFDDGWDIDQLEDAIRDMQPERVVVDDAHLQGDRLTRLRQLRTQMDASFAIAAVTWPGSAEDVSDALPGAVRFEIGELERDQILNVITEMGIGGPVALQAHLVNQAHGRVGLAVTLAYAGLTGGLQDIATGDVLLRDLVGWYRRTIGPESRYVLGFLALSGERGATLAQAGEALRLTEPAVADLIRGLASGGTLDEARRANGVAHLRVQPENLRYALVRDVYLSGLSSLPLPRSLEHLDDAGNAAVPLLGAMHRGAELDREVVRSLVDDRDSEAILAYSHLGPSELQEALELWPKSRMEIVREAHREGVDPTATLPLLLDAAIGDERPEHSEPDHPLRVIGDHIAASDRPVEIRETVVEVVDSWLLSGGDVQVGMRALARVMRPQMRKTSQDPGLGNTITLMEAPLPPDAVAELDVLWDRVLEIVARESGERVAPLINEVHSWVYPDALSFGRASFPEAEDAIRGVAPRIITRLADLLAGHPGALHQLRSYGTEVGAEIAVPPEFKILFPDHWAGAADDYEDWERAADSAVLALAEDAKSRSLEAQIELLHGSDEEATAAGISYPRLTPRLAQLLADSTSEPLVWVDELVRLEASPDLVLPFLQRSVHVEAAGVHEVLRRLLSDESYSWLASQVALTHPVGDELTAKGIAGLTAQHKNLLEWLLARGDVAADTVERLLNAPDPIVARDTAVALAHTRAHVQVSALSTAGQARWRDVIVASPADDYSYSEVLKRDPELFGEWLHGWFSRLSDSTDHWLLPQTLKEGIGGLPLRVRQELIEAIPADAPSFPLQDVVTELVASDLSTAEALLDRADLEDIHWVCLRRGPSEAWMERALLALDRGWEPEQIVGPTMFSESTWSGEESHHWQSTVDAFSRLGRSGDERRSAIIDAGVKAFNEMRDQAAAREHEERVFGFRRRGR